MTKRNSAAVPAVGAGTPVLHPGHYVRDTILVPKGMSVTAAARLVGVGRPALSNFVNGNVATTAEMAARIERAFGVPSQTLLAMQSAYDAGRLRAKGAPTTAQAYVPPFLGIKANGISTWASSGIAPRARLSVFLRTMVNSTGVALRKVDFPGNDDAERPGWDGFVEAAEGTPWVPQGLSGWELGTEQDIKGKADRDFLKSVRAVDQADRAETTFVFVTPHRWSRKAAWVAENRARGQWKDVRAYDASDLEQWLEQSIPGQAWFANETRLPSRGVRSLDKSWGDWAQVTAPPLAGELFARAVDGAKRTMLARLSTPPEAPTVVAADSIEEALAFLSQLFGEIGGELAAYRDRVLVFDEPGVLPTLAQGTENFIAIATTRAVERELAPLARKLHTIAVYPRNAANVDPHIVLEPLNDEAFRAGLEAMGYDRSSIDRYSNESGRSLTVLRRRLSTVAAVRTPEWAADEEAAVSLVPFLLVGAWNSGKDADQSVLALLANQNAYEMLEKLCQRFTRLNDAPLWSVGVHRGVISKIDLLFAIAGSVTALDLQRYFEIAKIVLGEDDPRLDLPEKDRWAASIHGKAREFSEVLRQGISETLVLLAVYGNRLFQSRLGLNIEIEAARLVRELLLPLSTRSLEANDRDLPTYAEAAPEEFLTILENDLHSADPASLGLMRPASSELFLGSGCPARTGLLWALEGLAWNPATLTRTACILARLAEVEINDNWANKPIGSLGAIFSAWMPQTAGDQDQRLAVMALLARRFPSVAWKVCVDQLGGGPRVGHDSHKPRWRTDAQGFGEPFSTWGPILAFRSEMIRMALNWEGHTREMLGDLIERLHELDNHQQSTVWALVKKWTDRGASDEDKALLREKIRVSVLSRRGVKRAKSIARATMSAAAKSAYSALEPSDLLSRHEWLFRDVWVEESADELQDDDMDFRSRDARISKLRVAALREVLAARGTTGVFELAERGKIASRIGWLMAAEVLAAGDIVGFVLQALPQGSEGDSLARRNLVFGALGAVRDDGVRNRVLSEAKAALSQADFIRLLLLAPFRKCSWRIVEELDEAHRRMYWSEVTPDWADQTREEFAEAVEHLLAAERPRAAFALVHINLDAINPTLLYRLMTEIAKGGSEQPGQYQLDSYSIESAFKIIDKSTELTLDQKAGLEFAYIDALAEPWRRGECYGIPNLEKYIETHPEVFVQALVWTYKRRGGGEDPKEWTVAAENVKNLAKRGHSLLEATTRIPGCDDADDFRAEKLAAWVKAVREDCAELGRLEVADHCLGQLFSSAPRGKDGVWPCESVREVMEDIQSIDISKGAHNGLYNARGVHSRGEGGDQERELAAKYRAWASALEYSYPFVASSLLMEMVRTYESEATHEDTEAGIRRRLQ